MKTFIKILLLVLCSIVAVGGVLIFIKTRVAPPSDLAQKDQYALALDTDCKQIEAASSYNTQSALYEKIDDKIRLFQTENLIDNSVSDEYRFKVDEIYGEQLITYGGGILRKSVWPETQLTGLQTAIDGLIADKLSTGERSLSDDNFEDLSKLRRVISDYREALALAKSTAFVSLQDAAAKISKATRFATDEYLQNNRELVLALNALPGKIADSHYNYVNSLVNSLAHYRSVSESNYNSVVIPRVDKALNDYKETSIYGSYKRGAQDLEDKAVDLINAAMDYYTDFTDVYF